MLFVCVRACDFRIIYFVKYRCLFSDEQNRRKQKIGSKIRAANARWLYIYNSSHKCVCVVWGVSIMRILIWLEEEEKIKRFVSCFIRSIRSYQFIYLLSNFIIWKKKPLFVLHAYFSNSLNTIWCYGTNDEMFVKKIGFEINSRKMLICFSCIVSFVISFRLFEIQISNTLCLTNKWWSEHIFKFHKCVYVI